MTLRALGRTHLPSAPDGAPGGYVLIRQSDSPGVPVLASPEPTLLPKLRVYFAEFPYPQYPAPEAVRLGDLLRFRYGRVLFFGCASFHARAATRSRLFAAARVRVRAGGDASLRSVRRARQGTRSATVRDAAMFILPLRGAVQRRLGPALSSRKPFSSSALGAKPATPSKICAPERSTARRRDASSHPSRPTTQIYMF